MFRFSRIATVAVVLGALALTTSVAVARPQESQASGVSRAGSPLVSVDGTVAGLTYAQWMVTEWRAIFAHPPGYAGCHTSHGITMGIGGVTGKPESYTCAVQGGAVYINGFAAECSTIEKAPFHGSTDAQLKRCAKRDYMMKKSIAVELDGRRIAHARYVVATRAFSFHLARKNVFGSRKRTGRSASYGEGFLLKDLTAGTHTVHIKAAMGSFKADVTWHLKAS